MSSVTESTTTKLPSAWAKEACDVINSKTDLKPVIGIVLGSGMGDVAKSIENPVVIPYGDLPIKASPDNFKRILLFI